ncbi:MAG: hypothetical protein UY78_C0047G0010 [Parcubacteria group bacterium GW2011_GWA1_53_13]|nr:MAG: hypothetical protein UY78_C0047G0010 [Parcubacteria group bacterium GW2011_GWA1_53_13]
MKTVIIVHGWDGSSKKDWMPWAKEALEKTGVKVVMPDMPHSEKPEIGECVQYLSSVVGAPDKDTYFIGHSIGCQTILRYLETINTPVGGAMFVAGWFNLVNLDGPEAEAIAKPWIETPMDFNKIKANLPRSIVMLGDNDPWVPYKEAKKQFEERFGSEVVVIKNGGHMTSDDGFGPFHQLVENFQKLSVLV